MKNVIKPVVKLLNIKLFNVTSVLPLDETHLDAVRGLI